jgi:hypothetical protein
MIQARVLSILEGLWITATKEVLGTEDHKTIIGIGTTLR